MHIKIHNQYQIELLKAINPIFGKYKIPGKVIYEVERILRYKRKTSNDYIALIIRPIKNDTTDILMELGIYEPEVEIPDNNFHKISVKKKKNRNWVWFDILVLNGKYTIFVVYSMRKKDLYRKKKIWR
ncbi:hypothetical protein FMM80_10215 [Schaedlerella arabinosiphila]|uniref:Uncharacterized protein n=1 Tax=Schaedlerella arabinosiphila TaxID=2044587 RepID=A0A9X5C6M2_9FIRM|nr:hypothetical protein [Schaedlerella arabinosiphila]KAI4440056.1 hypothetical protein C824_002545 [Schaedlerella arabinosiphila]NDO69034.1 hypothetical protein [Schaedlerella arabinosiphila]